MVGGRDSISKYEPVFMYIAYLLSKTHLLRSGRAVGPDTWAQLAYTLRYYTSEAKSFAEIYVPDIHFNPMLPKRFPETDVWTHVNVEAELWAEAFNIAASVHPDWDACSGYAQGLHTRNVFQVLGNSLDNPSEFCIYCADEFQGEVYGGTGTTAKLCDKYDVPKINIKLNKPNDIAAFLKEFNVDFSYRKAEKIFIRDLAEFAQVKTGKPSDMLPIYLAKLNVVNQ